MQAVEHPGPKDLVDQQGSNDGPRNREITIIELQRHVVFACVALFSMLQH